MVRGPRALRPVEFSFALADRLIVDARESQTHQPAFVELPVLVSVTPEPVAGIVAPLVRKAHRNAALGEGPQFLNQAVLDLTCPFAFSTQIEERGVDVRNGDRGKHRDKTVARKFGPEMAPFNGLARCSGYRVRWLGGLV